MPTHTQLPLYKCHKEVRAAKISGISPRQGIGTDKEYNTLYLENPYRNGQNMAMQDVSPEWMVRFKPEVGGYFVQYNDGYTSFSPAKAFEEGYTLV